MSLAALSVVRKPAVKEDRVVDHVTLDHLARRDHHRDVTTDGGLRIHVHLHDVAMLRDGDALKLDDGRLVRIRAAQEALYEIRAENPVRLARLAWHLGGGHVAMEATADALYTPALAALDELIRGQGVAFAKVTRAFDPERETHRHDHDHHHGHGHHGHSHHDHDHHHGPHDHGHAHHGHEAHGHAHHGHDAHDHGGHGHAHGRHADHGHKKG